MLRLLVIPHPMSLLFMLLSFIFYIKSLGKNNPIIYLLMLSSCALALLSRESALILPVLLLLYHYAFKRKIEAAKFVKEHNGQVCPVNWEPGEKTLKPGLDLVGKI